MNRIRFDGWDYALVADFDLLRAARDAAAQHAEGAEETTAQEREQTFGAMVRIALAAGLAG